MRTRFASWAGDLTRPVPLVAALVLAANDHLLKGAGVLPAAVTGKLSDVAGLLVAGIAAVAVARGVAAAATGRLPPRDGRLGVTVLAAVALVFAALKLWPAFNHAVGRAWGDNVLDAGDLWALPVLALAFLWLRDREEAARATPRRFASGLALVGVLLACAATPRAPPVPPPSVPGWGVGEAKLALPCGEVQAWVSKSGKTGAGLTVAIIRAAGVDQCEPTIVTATLRFRSAAITGREIPLADHHPARDGTTFHYLAFEFDNQARWNRRQRTAVFVLELELAGERRSWELPARHAYVDYAIGSRRDWH